MENPNKSPIEVIIQQNVAVIRFIRPEIKNPLSVKTLEAVRASFETLEGNANITGVVLTGSGDTFAAGADLNEVAKLNGETAREFGLRGQDLFQKISRSKKPVTAAIDGFCMGGAFDLALACRYRIASERSRFAHPGVNLGIITGWGGTQMLPRLIGRTRAMEIFLTARRVDAKEALKIGLIDRIKTNPLSYSVSMLSELTK